MDAVKVRPQRLVHIELHTRDRAAAGDFYAQLLGWKAELIETRCGPYLALGVGGLDGGIVACATARPVWLPYVEVDAVDAYTADAARLGARVLLEPREGPAGWRSVVATAHAGAVAFWQPKR